MSKTLTICALMGLGEDPHDSDLHGLRPFLVDQVAKDEERVGFLVYSHADPKLQQKIFELPGDIFPIGHSNGGEEEVRLDRLAYRMGRRFYAEMIMDAKPEWDSPQGFLDWFNFGFQYPTPQATDNFHAFYGSFGCPYANRVNSTKLDGVPHADFPGAPECQAWLGGMVDQWLRENPVETIA